MKYFVYFMVVIFLFVGGCSKKSENSSKEHKNQENTVIKIDTHSKPTMVIFEVSGCTYCKKLQNDINSNPLVKKRISKMSVYFVHADRDNKYLLMHNGDYVELTTKELAKVFGFRGGTPFIVIINKDSKPIMTLPGYLKPNTFSKALDYILDGSYNRMTLPEYLHIK